MPISNAPRTTVGSLGTGYDSLALDLLENVPALTFPLSMQTYGRMRTDPHIASVLAAYELPMRSASYAINPRGCRDEVVQLCADAWGLPIAGDNSGPGPARRRGVAWDDHLRLALLMLPFGFSPFAIRYDVGGDPMRARLAELSERLPQTITDIEVDDQGRLVGMRQLNYRELMPARNLLVYTHRREGSAYQGRSMLRESYGPWLLKHEMWRVMAQSSRRFGMGIPQVTAPSGGTPADVKAAAEIASGFRAGDQTGVGLPDGFAFDLRGLNGSVPDTLGFVNYLDAQMASSVLAEVLNLDTAATGNRALGDTVIGLLQMSWGAVAREITGPATQLNIQMVDDNFGEDEPVPSVLCTDINRPEITSEAISALVTCGALTPDITLENDLRNRYNLPVIEEDDRTEQRTPPPAPVPVAPVVDDRTNEQVPA